MRRIILLFLGIALSLSVFSQNGKKASVDTTYDHGSGIVFPELTPQLVDNLDLLGRVWGFLKYHHPTIAQGKYNWDYELFKMLPDYLQVCDQQQRDAYLVKWIRHYGKIQKNKNVISIDTNAFLKPDIAWINPKQLSSNLYNLLMNVYQNRYQGNNYYVTSSFMTGNVQFIHENPYSEMLYPDAGFRLLTAYRYWNMLQYFFPYRYLTDTDWNLVMKESIPALQNASDTISYLNAVKQMIAKCDDSHATFFSNSLIPYLKYLRTPFNVKFLYNDTLVVCSYRNPEKIDNLGPHIGDVITHIDNRPVQQLVDSLGTFESASSHRSKLRDIEWIITCGWEDSVSITFVSEGVTKQSTIPRYSYYDLNFRDTTDGVCYKVLADSIGYISMDDITSDFLKTFADTLKQTKGLILDLREYPKEDVHKGLGKLLSTNTVPYCKFSEPSLKNPGEFVLESSLYTTKGTNSYKGKIIILIDENTQSHAEYCTMYYRAIPNSLVIGTNSAGADGNVSHLNLPGGIQTMFSGLGVYYPDGTETQRVGIIPDLYVWPTVKGICEGRDEILEKAIEVIKMNNE